MNKFLRILVITVLGLSFVISSQAWAYNYGDFRSVTLATKAWKALEENDLEAVLAYTNKCIELYGNQATKQQESLEDYVEGTDEEIFANWALNDVATSLFIQAEAYRNTDMQEEATEAYQKIISDFTFGQTWDPQGWFWKPAEAAKEKIAMLESGSNLDFGDYTSEFLTTKAWKALEEEDYNSVITYTDKVLELYEDKAKAMQSELTDIPLGREKIFSYWALNDVGTSLFIKGKAYAGQGMNKKAKNTFQQLVEEFHFAQCWDPGPDNDDPNKGWFWQPASAAQDAIENL